MTADDPTSKPTGPRRLNTTGAVTGRVKAAWGSSAAYQSATPSQVNWPGGEFKYNAQRIASTRRLSNTAVHPQVGHQPFPLVVRRRTANGIGQHKT